MYATFGSNGAIVGALLTEMEDSADVAEWMARIAAEPDPPLKLEASAVLHHRVLLVGAPTAFQD